MGNHRWRGFEHPELHKMINGGPGAAASEPQTAYWESLTKELTEVDETLNTKLQGMGATWEGDAAERAKSGLTPLAEWASDAETGSTVMQISSENQAEYISSARASMPEPVKVTTPAPSGWQMAAAGLGAVTGNPGPAVAVAVQAADHEAQESAQNEAEQKAVQTMQTYESSSTWNRDTLGTFVKPPDVVVSTPPPQGGTPGFVTGAESQAGPEASGTQSTSTSGASIPSGSGSGGGVGTLTPGGGGSASPPTGGQVPVGSGVSAPPASTTPQSLLPTGQPPAGGPPAQPGPTIPNPTVGPANPGPGANNPLLPTFGQGPNPTGTGPNGPQTSNNRGPVLGRGPLPTGPNPATSNPAVPVNAGDAARRGVPLRGGLPTTGAPGAYQADVVRQGSQYGRGGVGGAVPGSSAVRNGPGAASAANGRGAVGAGGRGGVAGPVGAGGRRADGEDDGEHYAPDYLLETEDVFGDDRRVVPPVIGESGPQE